jgi:hypothetical protein
MQIVPRINDLGGHQSANIPHWGVNRGAGHRRRVDWKLLIGVWSIEIVPFRALFGMAKKNRSLCSESRELQ